MRLTGFAAALAGAALLAAPAQALVIGVDIEAGQGSPTNWTSYTRADVGSTVTNLVAEDGSITSVGFRLDDGSPTFLDQSFAPASGAVIPSHANDLTKICCDIFFGGPDPAVATWSGLTPLATYNYWVFVSSSAVDEITVAGDTVDVFQSPATDIDAQRINGVLGSSAQTFASYARQVAASAAGVITVSIDSLGTPTPSAYALELVVAGGPPSAIPLPAAGMLMLAGLGGFAGLRLTRRRKSG